MLNDTSWNGLTDILKRGDDSREKLLAPISNDDAITFAGVKFKQTSTAPSVTISGNTYYNTYLYGDDALFAVFLGRNPESGERNYKLLIQEAPQQGSVSDPARQIGGWCAYNVGNLALSKFSLIKLNISQETTNSKIISAEETKREKAA